MKELKMIVGCAFVLFGVFSFFAFLFKDDLVLYENGWAIMLSIFMVLTGIVLLIIKK